MVSRFYSVESAPADPATAWSQGQQTPLQRGVTRLQRGVSASRPRYSVVSRGYPYFSYARPEAHPRERQPVDEEDGYPRSADPDRPDGVSDGRHRLPARGGERAGLTGTPPCQMAPPVRERRPPVGTAARRAAGGSLRGAFTGAQAWGPQRCERCLPFQCTDHAERWTWDSRREGTTSELGVLPAARLRRAVPAPTGRTGQRSAFPCLRVDSAWWHGRHAPVQRPRGAFCDSVSAPEYEKCGLHAWSQRPQTRLHAWSQHRRQTPLMRGVPRLAWSSRTDRPRQMRGVPVRRSRSSVEFPRKERWTRDRWWAMQDLNLRLLPCEGSTLPLS